MTHVALLAYTSMGFHLQETDAARDIQTRNGAPPPIPLPERELAVYVDDRFALLFPSQLVTIILEHVVRTIASSDSQGCSWNRNRLPAVCSALF